MNDDQTKPPTHQTDALDRLSADDDWCDELNRSFARIVRSLRKNGVSDPIIYDAIFAGYHLEIPPPHPHDTDADEEYDALGDRRDIQNYSGRHGL